MIERYRHGDRVRLSEAAKARGLYRFTQDRVGSIYADNGGSLVTVTWDGRKTRGIIHRQFIERDLVDSITEKTAEIA
jgi:hypothetical protein